MLPIPAGPRLAERVGRIEPFHVMELAKMAADLERQGRSIIHMGIGEPDFTAPPRVVDAAERAIRDGKLQYTAATGIPALREAIAAYYARLYGLQVSPSRIIVTAGASGALLLASALLVERGAEVLMADPCYPCNRHFVSAFEGRAKLIPSGPSQRFQLSAAMVNEHWGEDTRGVLLASPSNPTGTSVAPTELKGIVDAVRSKGGFAIVDEIYQGLYYDGTPYSALALGDDVIVINSFSKYFNMTGWRLGWLVVPEALAAAAEKLAQNLFICASGIAQHAGVACFSPDAIAIYEQRKAEFRRRRDYIVPAMQSLGFGIPAVPDGAFYVYMDCSALADDADRLTRSMLAEAGVVLVPGMDFGIHEASRHIRLSYATAMDNLEQAVERLRIYFATRD